LDAATSAAAHAFKDWSQTSVLSRQRIMLDLQYLIRQNQDLIAENIVEEQGKTFGDAKGDVFRGLQVVEQACSLTSLLMGEKLTVAKDMETCKHYRLMINVKFGHPLINITPYVRSLVAE
jgi:malonate-semialdehyde dehydrogenase (acetylating)/methylmalonate-semialdehyde dehydrogenase